MNRKSDNQFGLTGVIMRFKSHYLSLFMFSAVINLLMLAPSWYMLQVYDRVLSSQDDNTLIALSLIVVFLYFVYALLEKFRSFILIGVSERIDECVTPRLHMAVIRSNSSRRPQDASSLTSLNTIKQFITGQPILSFLDAPWIIVYIGAMYLMHPLLGHLALCSSVILFALALVNQKMTGSMLAKAQDASLVERKIVSNISSAGESISVMGMQNNLQSILGKTRGIYLENLLGASMRGASISALTKFFRTLIQSVALGFGAYLVIHNELSAGMIIAATILLGRALAPIEGVLNAWKQLAEFRKAYASLDDTLLHSQEKTYTIELGRPTGKLQLIDVSLSLREHGRPTLDHINLVVEPGQTLVIIGPSGAGKTSLLKVLAGILKPSKGQALIDGSDLTFRDPVALGQHIGYLGQSTDLLAGNVANNIARFGDVDNDAVLNAAMLSGAHEVLLSLPEGYETLLGDGGLGLSEGQKRKIGLARALYRSPAILFMDEPGNGLDDVSLSQVMQAISALKKSGVTIIFTTHQNALVQLADKVLLMVDGKVQMHSEIGDVFPKQRLKQVGKV